MRKGTTHLKRLIAVLTITGMLVLTALPAAASSNTYTVTHCTKWIVQAIKWPSQQNKFWNQVNLLSVAPTVVHVRNRAIALLANDTQHRRNNLHDACWTVPGMGP